MRTFDVHPDTGKDAIDHESNDDCVCGPTTVPLPTSDGEVWWLNMHHGLTIGEQGIRQVGADEACAAGDEAWSHVCSSM